MKLIQILQEASDAELSDVKKTLKKNADTKILFKKGATLADVTDKAKFLATLKFHLLNNKKMMDFAKTRTLKFDHNLGKHGSYGVKFISAGELAKLRQITADKMTEGDFNTLAMVIKDLFTEVNDVESGSITAKTRKEIGEWANSNGRYFNLSVAAQTELSSIPALKPSKRVVLYRGILFKSYDLEKRESYDGTTSEGNGLKFLKQIRSGSKTVDLSWDRPSSWSTDKEIAERFAKFGPASSSFGATLNWLNRGQKAIDGELGFVIAIYADPKDILVDVSKIRQSFSQQHGDEGELILRPGKYLAKIVKRFNVQGEVDAAGGDTAKTSEEMLAAYDDIMKIKKLKIDELLNKIPKTTYMNSPHGRETTLEKSYISDVLHTDKTPVVIRLTDEINTMTEKYQKILKSLNEKYGKIQFTSDMADVNDDESVAKLKIVKDVMSKISETVKSSHFAESGNRGPFYEVPIDKLRMAMGEPGDLKTLSDQLRYSSEPRISDKSLGSWFNDEHKRIKGESVSTRFEMLGAAKQQPAVEVVLKDLFKSLKAGDYPETYKDALIKFQQISRRAYRNLSLLAKLQNIDYIISKNT